MSPAAQLNFDYERFRLAVLAARQATSPRLSRSWLAQQVGVKPTRIRSIELGCAYRNPERPTRPSLELVLRLCRVLGLRLEDFVEEGGGGGK